jgi:hypothetical protein
MKSIPFFAKQIDSDFEVLCLVKIEFFLQFNGISLENEHLFALGETNRLEGIDKIACGYFTECFYIQLPEILSQSSQA